MPQSSDFWDWYASANDSARNELIDKAWFGQNRPDTPMQDAVITSAPQDAGQGPNPTTPPNHAPDFEAVYGQDPEQEQEQEQ